ncbi:MAG: chorismate synthase [Thermodesulfovibrionales bacterium]
MRYLRLLTSGESHGPALIGVIEGLPAGLKIQADGINVQLRRRQGGYGRGGRMKIENDSAEIVSGVRWGLTLGSPIAVRIENRDWKNWTDGMSLSASGQGSIPAVTRPRPGHADLAGALKYHQDDVRNILERSSARETAMRVALGSIARIFLDSFGISIGSYVIRIGSVAMKAGGGAAARRYLDLMKKAEASPVRCPDRRISARMVGLIDRAIKSGNSLGGVFEVFAVGVPAGLGTHVQWDRKLDGRIGQAIMSIQAIKGVEIGLGFGMAGSDGAEVMDEIFYRKGSAALSGGFFRKTNHAGGIEGGMSNGMPIVVRAAMKPIPTLRKPLSSVDIRSKKPFRAAYERSDVCAVPAAAVVAEAMLALVLADAFLEKFGGDSMSETGNNYQAYIRQLQSV